MQKTLSEERKAFEQLCFYVAGGILIIVLLWLFLPALWKYFSPFIIAVPLAAILQPATRLLEQHLHLKHTPAVLIPVVLLFVIVAALILWFASFGINQIIDLLSHSNEVMSQASGLVRTAVSNILAFVQRITKDDVVRFGAFSDNAMTWLTTEITTWATGFLGRTVNWASNIPFIFLYINFLVFGVYFIARDFDDLLARFHHGMFGNPGTSTGKLTNSALVGFMGWLRMQLVYALLSLVVGSIYWSILGYQYGILISIAAAILEFLPVVGNGTIYIPWGIIAFLSGHPASGFQALGLFYGLLLIRRVTEPRILARNTGVPQLLSLIGMFAGLRLGGILGMIGGPVIATVALTLWEGSYRRTIVRDAQIVSAYLRTRWHGDTHDTTSSVPPEPAPSVAPMPASSSLKNVRKKNRVH